MTKKTDRYTFILNYFSKAQPDVESELNYSNAYELLVSTMLAAQCTDKRVNMVTPALFAAYPTPQALSEATEEEVLTYIKSVSYPNSKAQHLVAMAQKVVHDFGGEVPDTMERLTSLPGVGRKTANVVLAFAFGQAAMPVDTHVFRVAHRLGLVGDAAKPRKPSRKSWSSISPRSSSPAPITGSYSTAATPAPPANPTAKPAPSPQSAKNQPLTLKP